MLFSVMALALLLLLHAAVLTPFTLVLASASTHVASVTPFVCEGINHTAPVEIHIPPPPYKISDGGDRDSSLTNCIEVRISSCRYEAGLSIIIIMIPPAAAVSSVSDANTTTSAAVTFPSAFLSEPRAVIQIRIENSTLLAPTDGSGAAFLLSSFSSGSNGSGVEGSSFLLDLAIHNSTVRAHTTTRASAAAYAMRFVNIRLDESIIAVAGSTIEASANSNTTASGGGVGVAHAWAYQNVSISNSSILTTGSVLRSSSNTDEINGVSYVWFITSAYSLLGQSRTGGGSTVRLWFGAGGPSPTFGKFRVRLFEVEKKYVFVA